MADAPTPAVSVTTGNVELGGTVIAHANNVNISTLEATVGSYYRAIAKQCEIHTLVDVNATGSALPDQPRADQVYVPPDVWVTEQDRLPKKGASAAKGARDGMELSVPKRVPLHDCLSGSDAKFQRIVLTATSGMGKTTAVNQQMLALAASGATPWLALRLPSLLKEVKQNGHCVEAALRSDVLRWVECSAEAAAGIAAEVIAKLDAAPGVILFDALDEVPASERAAVLNAVRQFIAARKAKQPQHRIVLTSRPYAYKAELVQEGFALLPLAPFTDEQLDALIEQYFSRVVNEPAVGGVMQQQVQRARSVPAQQAYVALLAEPMLATYACMLASEGARAANGTSPLPSTRFELFDGVVRLMLEKWEPGRASAETKPLQPMFERDASRHKNRSPLRAMLEAAAFGLLTQVNDQTALDDTSKRALTHERLVSLADAFMPADLPVRAGEVVRWLAERTAFLPLFSEQPTKLYQLHLQLGSFLAAGGLHAQHSDDCDFAEALVDALVRAPESSRQMVTMGLARLRGQSRALIATVNALLEATKAPGTTVEMEPHSWQALASFAIAFADAVPPATWLETAGNNLNTALDPLRERLLQLITTQKLSAAERSAAADALGLLGDPRFRMEPPRLMCDRLRNNPADEPIRGFVRIPADPFRMGHKSESDNAARSVSIKGPFYIARTLTTVAQYQCFVDAGGYEMDKAIWDAQGIRWRSGTFTSKVEEEVYKNWLARRPAALRLQPWEWSAQLAHPNRAVTGVCWFEARAYARWLDTQISHVNPPEWAALRENGYAVRLPTEDQWERAARASSLTATHAHRWPWGDDEAQAKSLANVSQNIGHVTSPGVFPPNAIGLSDMAGNAWQWMDNLYSNAGDFTRVEHGRTLITDKDDKKCERPALRGGSWIGIPEGASCSYRGRDLPGNSGNNMGVRVVLSLAE